MCSDDITVGAPVRDPRDDAVSDEKAETPVTPVPPVGRVARYQPGHTTYPGLDGLRALAVLAVVTTHCAYWTGRYERGWGTNALARLDFGVAIFFVLSGFLLVRPWLTAARTGGTPLDAGVRPAPGRAHHAGVLIAVALRPGAPPPERPGDRADWVRHLTLVQIYQYGWMREGLTQTWSLATEVAFYVLLPVVGLLSSG